MKRILPSALIALLLAACEMPPHPPRPDYGNCVASHTETYIRPAFGNSGFGMDYGGGISVGGGMAIATRTECDQYEYPAGDGPGYQRERAEYPAKIKAWNEAHPK